MTQEVPAFFDEPPSSEGLTDYDRKHMVLYMRLIDSARDGANWQEVVQVLFGLDPATNSDRCRKVYDMHLARARWMTEQGYRELARESQRPPAK